MDFIALFKDFGFPALVTGVLLWMYATKLEKINVSNENLKASLEAMKVMVNNINEKVGAIREDTSVLRENTRPTKGER